MKHYCVAYKDHYDGYGKVCVPARNKYDAYDKAYYEAIPAKHGGRIPYSAWVVSVTYNNGNHREFNSTEGNRYGD